MRAALLEAGGKPLTLVDDVEVKDLIPGHVRVKVHHCGICHSDMTSAAMGGATMPLILGHEAAGVVEEVGPEGVDLLASGWAKGADLLAGKHAALRASVGEGSIYMFGADVVYRGQPLGTMKLLFNAIQRATLR